MTGHRKIRSISQRVGNRGSERGIDRDDAFTAYVMDRLLHRLGQSRHATELVLKGGVLVANLVGSPHRFTRDIDVLRRQGKPSPNELRELFRQVIAGPANDGIAFPAKGVRAIDAEHDEDGYNGVKVFVRARLGKRDIEIRIDVGFGDAVVPPATRMALTPFLDDDTPATVLAYGAESVIAEKVETVLGKFPLVLHRLKDVLDVISLSQALAFEGAPLTRSLGATLSRRHTAPDTEVLRDMHAVIGDRRWQTAWASMLREKAVVDSVRLETAVCQFEAFVGPVLRALASATERPPGSWKPGGPWR